MGKNQLKMPLLAKYLENCREKNYCIDIYREEFCNDTILGIPCFIGDEIIGLAQFTDAGRFDGYCFINQSDISRVRHGGNEQNAIFSLMEQKGQLQFAQKAKENDFHFQNMREVVEQFKTEVITIFIEKVDPDICFLGTIQEYDSEYILLKALGTFESLDITELILRWGDITRIEVESLYLKDIKSVFSSIKK